MIIIDDMTGEQVEAEKEAAADQVEQLIKSGNLMFCQQCFDAYHHRHHSDLAERNRHLAVELFAAKADDDEQQSVLAEDCESEVRSLIEVLVMLVETRYNDALAEEKSKSNQKQLLLNDIDANVDKFESDLKCLQLRSEQFNDVKQTIRQTNDLIRDELSTNFATITSLMRVKLDSMSESVKERLKDAYSVIRDNQLKVNAKISELKSLTDQIKGLRADLVSDQSHVQSHLRLPFFSFQFEDDDSLVVHDDDEPLNKETKVRQMMRQVEEHIFLVNEELKFLCREHRENKPCNVTGLRENGSVGSSGDTLGAQSCSLFVENNLYPQFNIYVDTSKLIVDVKELELRIGSSYVLSPRVVVSEGKKEEK
jgi:hypothetical protein